MFYVARKLLPSAETWLCISRKKAWTMLAICSGFFCFLALQKVPGSSSVLTEKCTIFWRKCMKLAQKQVAKGLQGPAFCRELSPDARTDSGSSRRGLLNWTFGFLKPCCRESELAPTGRAGDDFQRCTGQLKNEISGTHFLTCWSHQGEALFWLRPSVSLIPLC